jgi:hypothetical protein
MNPSLQENMFENYHSKHGEKYASKQSVDLERFIIKIFLVYIKILASLYHSKYVVLFYLF